MHYILDANKSFITLEWVRKSQVEGQEGNSFHLHTHLKVDLGEVAQHFSKTALIAFTSLALRSCVCVSVSAGRKDQGRESPGSGLEKLYNLGHFYFLLRIQGNSRKVVWREEPGEPGERPSRKGT